MKVKDLKDLINNLDDDMEVILQKDSEGNGYSPLSGGDEAVYVAESSYSGDVYSLNWSAEDCDLSEDEWEKIKKQPHCIVLYPIN